MSSSSCRMLLPRTSLLIPSSCTQIRPPCLEKVPALCLMRRIVPFRLVSTACQNGRYYSVCVPAPRRVRSGLASKMRAWGNRDDGNHNSMSKSLLDNEKTEVRCIEAGRFPPYALTCAITVPQRFILLWHCMRINFLNDDSATQSH